MDYIKGAATAITMMLPLLLILLYKLWSGRTRSLHTSDSVGNASPELDSPASASKSADSHFLPLPIGEYEVFLTFRSPDTRYQITDILYRFLVNLKIRTFKDDDELRKGEGIWPSVVRAIEQSKIYIPIFSENYAYSKWCLGELAAIVERQERNLGCLILPIFYMVDPRDVRHQSGPYRDAFRQHEKFFDEETVRIWKAALNKVGALKGWHVKSSDEQGAIADLVTGVVWSHLSKNNNDLETDKLIGIDDHIEVVKERLALDSPCMTIVGIHGIGGIGKTTVAKAVYNKVSPQFDRCSFVEDVREMLQQRDGAVILQKHIISDILKVKNFAESIANNSEGIRIIQDRISRFKLLIVLDDVDEKFEFDKILGNIKNFVSRSRFIITSRNVKVLSTLTDECKLYRVREMNHHHSLQLFCNHAFKHDSPPSSYETLSKDIVSIAAGLPLALKVLGSDLFQEEVVIWEDKLRLLQEIPEEEIMQRLRISYDSLKDEAKQIFLDIACFFIGEDKELPSYMWSDCGFFPITSINILKQRSLIEITSHGYPKLHLFRMHDQLRDMGREIVRQESIKHQMMGSRIWSEKKALYMLIHKKGTNRVTGIRVYHNDFEVNIGKISQECFMNLSELRYLNIQARMSIDDISNCIPNLKWLRLWIGWLERIPKFSVENLVILELEGWRRDDLRHIKMATKLKVLKLSGYRQREFPEFPRSLEILHLANSMYFLDPKDLDIGNLENLKVLRLEYSGVRKIKGMRALENIEGLHLFPSSLTSIFIKECWALEWLPSLEKLEKLTDLSIESCSDVKEIVGLGGLKALETLRIRDCPLLTSLRFHDPFSHDHYDGRLWEASVGDSLRELRIMGATPLVLQIFCRMIQLFMFPNLTKLTLKRDVGIGIADIELRLDGIESMDELVELNLYSLESLRRLPSLAKLGRLKVLTLNYTPYLLEIEGLAGLKSLEVLDLTKCTALERLPADHLLGLQQLKILDITGCTRLIDLSALRELEPKVHIRWP